MTNTYREVLYLFLQRFIYRGQMALFGTTANPVGCAVAYRRTYLAALFDHFEPLLGDDLTNSEDIFIGLAMLNEGYRNIQLTDVHARTVEPEVQRLPRQVYLWSSAFLQSSFYFDALLKSPFKAHRRWRLRRADNDSNGPRPTSRHRSIPSRAAGRLEPAVAAGGHATSAGPAPMSLASLFSVASGNRGALSIEWPGAATGPPLRRFRPGSVAKFRSRIGRRSGASIRRPTAVLQAWFCCHRRWKESPSRPSS